MPCRLRLTLAGVAVHLIQRGNNRGACFFADEDFAHYLDDLAEFAPRFGYAVHAFMLMANHVHLLLRPQQAGGASWPSRHWASQVSRCSWTAR
jgi:putative transposase